MDDNTNNNKYLLPPKTSNLKTLVLDLDETLVHSQFVEFSSQSDIIIKIEIEKEIYDIHVLVRPGVKEFLEKMKNFYEIVIFTASISKYADILLNIIDQKGCAPYRLFREHCTFINNIFVKDLQKLGRNLKDIIILDNSPLSYSFHPNNGLPILSWFEDKTDRELYNITPILMFLSNVNDVRDFIPKFVINNSISYSEAEKLFKKYGYNQEKGNYGNNCFAKKLTKIKSDDTIKINNNINNNNLKEKQNRNNNLKSNEYNINIQIVQNNINNYNNIINEKQTNEIKNKLIKYLNTGNNESKAFNEKKQITEKILNLKQKNIIASVDNPCLDKKIIEKKEKNKCHKRHNTINININHSPKFAQNDKEKDKEKKYNKINTKNKNNINSINSLNNIKNVKNVIQRTHIENNKKNNKSLNQINNIINKKRKRGETPSGKINSIIFSQNSSNINNKINKISIQKKGIRSNSKNEKRNNSNNTNNKRAKLFLPIETSDFNLFKRLCTLTSNPRNNNNKKKRNLNQLNFMPKTKIKSKSNQRFYLNRDDNMMSYSINFNHFNLNNNIYKTFKIGENFMKPSHKKQNSYNENNFFLKIKKNLIKAHELKTKRIINKNDFLKNEIKKVNNINQINTISNINSYKNKLIKRTYGNFKKINLKNIDFITRRDKKKVQIDIKTKNIDNNNNLNRLKLNENIFNLYKTFHRNDKNEENTIFNNTSDKFINDKNTYRKINHQKTISYNFNSTRNINNILLSKNKIQNKYRRIYNSRIKSMRKPSNNEFNDFQEGTKHSRKEDNIIYIKNMFKNKIFDFVYYTRDNIKDINKINSKKGNKNLNKNQKNRNNNK